MSKFNSESERNAYFAGLFDGEGYVGISSSSSYHKKHLSLRVVIGNKHPQPLRLATTFWGANVYERVDKRSGNSHFIWDIKAEKAEKFLLAVQPYLIIKKKQVRIALEFRRISAFKNVGFRRRTEAIVDKQFQLKHQIQKLNSPMGFSPYRTKEV